MAINEKIMDKIVSKCVHDLEMSVALTNLLEIESIGMSNYKKNYQDAIEKSIVDRGDDNED